MEAFTEAPSLQSNTKSVCFLCLATTNEKDKGESKILKSIRNLLCYLQMECVPGASKALISYVENKIKLGLCNSCEEINKRFSVLLMEMDYVLRQINNCVTKSETNRDLIDSKDSAQLELLENLRKEVAKRSLERQVGPTPCVKLDRVKEQVTVKIEVIQEDTQEEVPDFDDDHFDPPSESPRLSPEPDANVGSNSIVASPQAFQKAKGTVPTRKRKLEGFQSIFYSREDSTGMFHCRKCEKTSMDPRTVRRHYERVHMKKKFKCDICNTSVFSRADILSKHKKTCREAMAKAAEVKKQREKFAFVCEVCGKRFDTNSNLSHHRLVVHKNTDRYPCDLCDKRFKRMEHLNSHRDGVHLGVRFYCSFCNKSFKYKCMLRTHEKKCSSNPKMKEDPQEEV